MPNFNLKVSRGHSNYHSDSASESDSAASSPSGSPKSYAYFEGLSSRPKSPAASSSSQLRSSLASLSMNSSRVSLLRPEPSFTEQSPANFRQHLAALGKNYRTSKAEQREFREAFVAHRYDNCFQDGEQDYADYAQHIASVVDRYPSLAHIPVADLVALRVWTSNDYGRVQDSLEAGQRTFPESVPFARAIVSALNALPEEFTHTGRVFTGEDQSLAWVNERYTEGASRTDWRFFATSETIEGAWQNRSVDIETISATGKRIGMFSTHPQENEVLFPPGTRFFVESVNVEEQDGSTRVKIVQHEMP